LIAVRLRFPRPATGFRRRSLLFGGLLAVLGASLAARSYETVAAGGPPFSPERPRAALLDAVRALRPHVPGAARHVDRLIADAEVVTSGEAAAPFWSRTPGRTQAAWSRALVVAHGSLAELRRREASLAESWATVAASVGPAVRLAVEESGEAAFGRREIAAAQQATLKWKFAQSYAAAGDHARAIAEAEKARVFTKAVRTSFVALHSRFSDPKNLRHWRALVAETVARSKRERSTAFVVDKLRRRLHVYTNGQRVASYNAEIGAKGLMQKIHAGDQATPEGRYRVTEVRGPGRTRYYKALLIDYPNAEDRARYNFGKRNGQVPGRAGIGSLIEIHGDGGQGRDWTDGCVALTDSDMDRVFAKARVGTPVTIVGTF
jgi:L,D-peptidoglycan transpeptidase YkuD (ErfK/YbiS/YcfS/YnhG family)